MIWTFGAEDPPPLLRKDMFSRAFTRTLVLSIVGDGTAGEVLVSLSEISRRARFLSRSELDDLRDYKIHSY